MLRVAEHFEKSDTGRQRRANEDSFFVRAPLFVVADGMGGAQAGEVASRLAAETFAGGLPDDGTPEQRLEARVRDGEHAHPRGLAGGPRAQRHGHDAHGRLPRRRRAGARARRRQPRLPAARRRAVAPHARPHARRGARAPRRADRAGGGRAPAALDHHARARPRTRHRHRPPHPPRAGRRRAAAVQRRPHGDDRRGRGRGRSSAAPASLGDAGRALVARRERGRRPRQHHGRPVPAGGGRGRAAARTPIGRVARGRTISAARPRNRFTRRQDPPAAAARTPRAVPPRGTQGARAKRRCRAGSRSSRRPRRR